VRSKDSPLYSPMDKPVAGRGPLAPSSQLDKLDLLDGAMLQQKLLSIFRAPSYKPPVLPNIAIELSELARRKNVAFDEVARLVEKDPLIAASVLKLAQSPLYGGRLSVQSLRNALNRLGISKLRDMVWQVAMDMRMFRVEGYMPILERLQSHSTLTAYAARIVAQQTDFPAEQAFLSGLLHDMGWSGTLIALSEGAKSRPMSAPLMAAINSMHAEAGAAMAKLWGLSDEIVEAIKNHHKLSLDQRPASLLVPILCVAEHLADEFGFGIEPAASADPLLDSAIAPFGLVGLSNDPNRERFDGHAAGRYEKALALLGLAPKMSTIREQLEQAAQGIQGGDYNL
jgi:putative nucleotidyltransferase with HDIG domain